MIQLVEEGTLDYRDNLSFEEMLDAVKKGFIARRMSWFFCEYTHVFAIGGKSQDHSLVLMFNGFGHGPVPYDHEKAKSRGDTEAEDWMIATYEQFFNDNWRLNRHLSYAHIGDTRRREDEDARYLPHVEIHDPNQCIGETGLW